MRITSPLSSPSPRSTSTRGSGSLFVKIVLLFCVSYTSFDLLIRRPMEGSVELLCENTAATTTTILNNDPAPIPSSFAPGERPPWVILMEVNNGYYEFLQNWMKLYQRIDFGGRTNVGIVVVAFDEEVLKRIRARENGLVLPPRTIVMPSPHMMSDNAASHYGTKAFGELMANRPSLILEQFAQGSSVILSDIDIAWLKDPFPYLIDPIDQGKVDLQFQLEARKEPNEPFLYCAGFFAAANNAAVKDLMTKWAHVLARDKPTRNQPPLNKILRNTTEHSVRHQPLPIETFQSGKYYWGNTTETGTTRDQALVAHNNWITGREKKLARFVEAGLWLV